MKNKGKNGIERGQAITFRIPSDTPDHILKQLQRLKEKEKRNFSSTVAQFVVDGVNKSLTNDREAITVPLPKALSQAQRNWLKHEHSEAILGSILYQLLADPIRSTSILASLNSNALDIDEALYLQESEELTTKKTPESSIVQSDKENVDSSLNEVEENDTIEDDLMNFDWETAKQEFASSEENKELDEEDDTEDLLGGFLSRMNK
ncbi:hypothetical protein [Pseudalkalibacillus caeni]|uniref:Uncharacterized protein n=1 Tax=Exobacillus caeni TaxID=2574798 RepID=A0A5R9EVW7_9BACL|nr:hypothetical protein [Pseudalkalibacillus caeni]TLS35382.1 hypothetical protein FCL54_20515 [Pseudalkalibacillus caeni]